MVIHSFDGVLRQPRTMHTFQLWPGGPRWPLPRPLPMIAIVYMAGVFVATLAADKVLGLTAALTVVLSAMSGGRAYLAAWVIFHLAVPAAIVWAALNAEIDGRAPYRWLYSVAAYARRDKRAWCGKRVRSEGERIRCSGRTRVFWDEDAPRLQHGWVRGGSVTTTAPARFTSSLRHRRHVIKADGDGHLVVAYEVDGALEVRP